MHQPQWKPLMHLSTVVLVTWRAVLDIVNVAADLEKKTLDLSKTHVI